MLIKRNNMVETIEDKMRFKFEDLRIIGKFINEEGDNMIYKSKNNIIVMVIQNTIITAIIKTSKFSDSCTFFTFNIGDKIYKFDCEVTLIIHSIDKVVYTYCFEINDNWIYIDGEKLELENEEAVTIKLLNEFVEDGEISPLQRR